MTRERKRLLLTAGLVCVGGVASLGLVFFQDISETFFFWRLRQDPELLSRYAADPKSSPRYHATIRFCRSEKGGQEAFERYLTAAMSSSPKLTTSITALGSGLSGGVDTSARRGGRLRHSVGPRTPLWRGLPLLFFSIDESYTVVRSRVPIWSFRTCSGWGNHTDHSRDVALGRIHEALSGASEWRSFRHAEFPGVDFWFVSAEWIERNFELFGLNLTSDGERWCVALPELSRRRELRDTRWFEEGIVPPVLVGAHPRDFEPAADE